MHNNINTMLAQNQILHYLSANKQSICQKYHLTKLGVLALMLEMNKHLRVIWICW